MEIETAAFQTPALKWGPDGMRRDDGDAGASLRSGNSGAGKRLATISLEDEGHDYQHEPRIYKGRALQ